MSDPLKIPISDSVNRLARRQAQDLIFNTGRALPCTVMAVEGQMVTVAFAVRSNFTIPQVTMPIATSFYDWLPVQVGDMGITMAADVYIDIVSGLGTGQTPTFATPGNLSALVYVPISNAAWVVPTGGATADQRVVQGPGGAVIQDTAGNVVINVTTTGVTVILPGGAAMNVEGNVTVTGTITAEGDITAGFGGADSVTLQNHLHAGVTTGSGNTAPPNAGT